VRGLRVKAGWARVNGLFGLGNLRHWRLVRVIRLLESQRRTIGVNLGGWTRVEDPSVWTGRRAEVSKG